MRLQFTPMEKPLFTLCATEILSAVSLAEAGRSPGASEFLAVLFHVLIGIVCKSIYFFHFVIT